jgi:hypothetical protein
VSDEPEDGLVVSRIVITRYLTDNDLIDHVSTQSEDGYEMGLSEALGMMRLAEDTLIRSAMEPDGDE